MKKNYIIDKEKLDEMISQAEKDHESFTTPVERAWHSDLAEKLESLRSSSRLVEEQSESSAEKMQWTDDDMKDFERFIKIVTKKPELYSDGELFEAYQHHKNVAKNY